MKVVKYYTSGQITDGCLTKELLGVFWYRVGEKRILFTGAGASKPLSNDEFEKSFGKELIVYLREGEKVISVEDPETYLSHLKFRNQSIYHWYEEAEESEENELAE